MMMGLAERKAANLTTLHDIARGDNMRVVRNEAGEVIRITFRDLAGKLFSLFPDGNINKCDKTGYGDEASVVWKRICNSSCKDNGYKYVRLSLDCTDNTFMSNIGLHTVIAMMFDVDGFEAAREKYGINICVNHKDNDPTNNSVDNLEWVPNSFNNLHGAIINSTFELEGESNIFKTVTWTDTNGIEHTRKALVKGISAYDIARVGADAVLKMLASED